MAPARPSGDTRFRSQHGFTLVEMAVTAVAFGLIMLGAFALFARVSEVTNKNHQFARTQADVRAAMDQLERDLRSAGVDIEYAAGQQRFVYADAFQVAFNANIFPLDDNGNGFPGALRASAAGAAIPGIYTPAADYETGAETIVFTLDSNGDGLVSKEDGADDAEEESRNPKDVVLYRNSYGWDGQSNAVERSKVALIRGPEADPQGNLTTPLFSYLIDHDDDRTTEPQLHGDTNGDGVLSPSEIVGLTPLTTGDLARLERIRLEVTGETTTPDKDHSDNDGYHRISLGSEIQIRQAPMTRAVVYGRVFKDTDGNGSFDQGEEGISGVVVRTSTGAETRTNGDGVYAMTLSPGQMTISEIDPPGYTSSTSNSVAIDVIPGGFMQVEFGDISGSGSGTIKGVVWDDPNSNGIHDEGEGGRPGVKVYSDTGEHTYTDETGAYSFAVPVGPRTISKVDSEGYLPSTPNSVGVELEVDGEEKIVNFAEYEADESGTIQGYVYLDENRNQVRDNGEDGVPGADLVVGGLSVESDATGFFSITVPAGTHKVTEIDPPGYSSTTSNTKSGVVVEADAVVTVYFGDIVQEDVDFDIIQLADTERALSIGAGNLGEDNKGDPDLVLGTRFSGGANNLLVWTNQRKNSRTPNTALFDDVPDYTRPNVADVTSLEVQDLNSDGDADVVTGLTGDASFDLNVWMSDGGDLEDLPEPAYAMANGSGILDFELADLNQDGILDAVVGVVESGEVNGHVEVWFGNGDGSFQSNDADDISRDATPLQFSLGAVTAVALGDVSGDGWDDLAVGSLGDAGQGVVSVYWRSPLGSPAFLPYQSWTVQGKVTGLELVDMVEDDTGDVDVLVAVEQGETLGGIELWLQHDDAHFGLITEAGRGADDWMPTTGSPLSLIVQQIDNDVFPDLLIGTRSGASYEGMIQLARPFGYLPGEPQDVTETAIGTVVTMTTSDFNLDNVMDVAVGTQNSATQGSVILLFRR